MSAVKSVRHNMERLVPKLGEDREDLARRMFYLQMEIYSSHAMTDLYQLGDYEDLSTEYKEGWLKSADLKLQVTTRSAQDDPEVHT